MQTHGTLGKRNIYGTDRNILMKKMKLMSTSIQLHRCRYCSHQYSFIAVDVHHSLFVIFWFNITLILFLVNDIYYRLAQQWYVYVKKNVRLQVFVFICLIMVECGVFVTRGKLHKECKQRWLTIPSLAKTSTWTNNWLIDMPAAFFATFTY
jgi:hypothetical protein